jgi:hypothetical protein
MKKLSFLLLLSGLLWVQCVIAQTISTPFTAVWDFNNSTPAGASSDPALVSASSLAPVGVNFSSTGYPISPSPGSGRCANVQSWSTVPGACKGGEYVEFGVTPQIGAKDKNGNVVKSIDITEVSFLVSSSGSGPRQLLVTSSLTGFNLNAPLYQTTLSQDDIPFSWVPVSIAGIPSSKSITTTVTFRIVACQATATGGTLRLDNITINGDIMLPADIVSFTARADNQQVRLDWATSWERNAERFVAEGSTDLLTFRRVGEVAAAGTTNQRQQYSLTDETPAPGPNYYRLRQIDRNGSVAYSKIISAIVRPDAPTLLVWPNPADRQQITLQISATNAPELTVTDMLGRVVTGRLVVGSGSDAAFVPDRPLAAGRYWLRLVTPAGSAGVAVLVP